MQESMIMKLIKETGRLKVVGPVYRGSQEDYSQMAI
jgi:hypothetical protein